MADPELPPDDPLSSLRRRIDAARKHEAVAASRPPASPAALALRFGGEFGAGILVGALLGLGADHFLHSSPWGLTIGLTLGFVTGVVNVVRIARIYNEAKDGEE